MDSFIPLNQEVLCGSAKSLIRQPALFMNQHYTVKQTPAF